MLPKDEENESSESYQSSACGKAIIVGEHAAIHGSLALAIPLKELKVSLSFNPEKDKQQNSFNENVGQRIHDKIFPLTLIMF